SHFVSCSPEHRMESTDAHRLSLLAMKFMNGKHVNWPTHCGKGQVPDYSRLSFTLLPLAASKIGLVLSGLKKVSPLCVVRLMIQPLWLSILGWMKRMIGRTRPIGARLIRA